MPWPRKKYETPELLGAACEEYFKKEDQPTLAGLCLHLGMHRETFRLYREEHSEKQPEFREVCNYAMLHLQETVERALLYRQGSVTGPLFWLKNHAGYKDVKELGGQDGGSIKVVLSKEDMSLC